MPAYSGNRIDTDLIPNNIRNGVDIYGVVGNYSGDAFPNMGVFANSNELISLQRVQVSHTFASLFNGTVIHDAGANKYLFYLEQQTPSSTGEGRFHILKRNATRGPVAYSSASSIISASSRPVAFLSCYLDGGLYYLNTSHSGAPTEFRYITWNPITNVFGGIVVGTYTTGIQIVTTTVPYGSIDIGLRVSGDGPPATRIYGMGVYILP